MADCILEDARKETSVSWKIAFFVFKKTHLKTQSEKNAAIEVVLPPQASLTVSHPPGPCV